MTTITVSLPDEHVSELHDKAIELGMTTEELVRVSISELLRRPNSEFQQALDYVMQKNRNLYRRLS